MSAPAADDCALVAVRPESRRAHVLRRLHSLSGVVPVGLFLVEHLWTNAAAMGGARAFDRAVRTVQSLPGLAALEIVGIFIPLAFHASYGLYLTVSARPNVRRYPYRRNWLYLLQRASGVVVFAFVAVHLYEFRVQKWLFGLRSEDFFTALAAHLSRTMMGIPVPALVYILGVAAAVFHFTNGLWGFCASWGITVSRRAQQRSAVAFGLLGASMFVLGTNTVIYFATGSRLLVPAPARESAGSFAPCAPR